MDNKIKLVAVASIVAVVASGCSGYRSGTSGANQQARSGEVETYNSQGSGQVAGGSQVSRGGLFGQRRPAATCAPCAAKTQQAKSTYTYKPAPKPVYRAPAAPKPVYRAPAQPAGQHTQQWYVDRWKRQQAAGRQQTTNKTNKNYSGYGGGNYNYDAGAANNTNYYDYSTAGQKKANTNNTVVTASNKSIYTGSYQQKTYQPYKPTTYAGGSAATTNTTTTYSAPAATSTGGGSGNVYIVKKGDTVFEIMRQTGVYWKDIIKLNNLTAPYNISPGQRIRLK